MTATQIKLAIAVVEVVGPGRRRRRLTRDVVGRVVAVADASSGHTAFAFDACGRVIARTDDRNVTVNRLFDRLGFRLEGRFVDADWFKDEWTTLRVYAVLARDWPVS